MGELERMVVAMGSSRAVVDDGDAVVRARQVMGARQRVQQARVALAAAERELEAQLEALSRRATTSAVTPVGSSGSVEPSDVTRLEGIRRDLEAAHSAQGRRARREAAKEVLALELAQRLVLSRLGFATYEEFDRSRADAPHTAPDVIDLAYLEFARMDLERAERELEELVLPVRRPIPAIAATKQLALAPWSGPPPLPRRKAAHLR